MLFLMLLSRNSCFLSFPLPLSTVPDPTSWNPAKALHARPGAESPPHFYDEEIVLVGRQEEIDGRIVWTLNRVSYKETASAPVATLATWGRLDVLNQSDVNLPDGDAECWSSSLSLSLSLSVSPALSLSLFLNNLSPLLPYPRLRPPLLYPPPTTQLDRPYTTFQVAKSSTSCSRTCTCQSEEVHIYKPSQNSPATRRNLTQAQSQRHRGATSVALARPPLLGVGPRHGHVCGCLKDEGGALAEVSSSRQCKTHAQLSPVVTAPASTESHAARRRTQRQGSGAAGHRNALSRRLDLQRDGPGQGRHRRAFRLGRCPLHR